MSTVDLSFVLKKYLLCEATMKQIDCQQSPKIGNSSVFRELFYIICEATVKQIDYYLAQLGIYSLALVPTLSS